MFGEAGKRDEREGDAPAAASAVAGTWRGVLSHVTVRDQASTNPGRPSSLSVLTACSQTQHHRRPLEDGKGVQARGGERRQGSLRPHRLLCRVQADEAGGLLGRVPLTECGFFFLEASPVTVTARGRAWGPLQQGQATCPRRVLP